MERDARADLNSECKERHDETQKTEGAVIEGVLRSQAAVNHSPFRSIDRRWGVRHLLRKKFSANLSEQHQAHDGGDAGNGREHGRQPRTRPSFEDAIHEKRESRSQCRGNRARPSIRVDMDRMRAPRK